MAKWDILLYSNRDVPESFGRTAAEAMRAGCVPVMDRLGGFVEQVRAGCGYLCSTRDDFVAALEELSDGAVRERLSLQAKRHADAVFSMERFGVELRHWLRQAQRNFADKKQSSVTMRITPSDERGRGLGGDRGGDLPGGRGRFFPEQDQASRQEQEHAEQVADDGDARQFRKSAGGDEIRPEQD